jgi:hypothetical protein
MKVGVITDGFGLGTLINSQSPLGTDRLRQFFFETSRRLTLSQAASLDAPLTVHS